jgi:hypothetical protein
VQRQQCAFLRSLYNCFSPLIKYLANALSHYDVDEELDDIDDIGNGLVLWYPIYRMFGDGVLSFLKVSHQLFCSVQCNLQIQIDL